MNDMTLTPFAEEQKQYKAAYAEYQKNTTAAADLQAKILKGLKEGKPIVSLLLLALEALAKLTHETAAFEQAKADLTAVYGYGLHDPGAVSLEAAQLEDRLEKMNAAINSPDVPPDAKRQIEKAVRAQRKALEWLHSN